VVIDDVWGIDKSLGIKFKGDKSNMGKKFKVLSRGNKSCWLGDKINEGCEAKEVTKRV